MSEVHSATQRALRATNAGSPLMKSSSSAPASGRKVMAERSGKPFIASRPLSMHLNEEIPGDKDHHPNQHGEGVVIHIPGLQGTGAPRQPDGRRGDSIGAETIDNRAVAAPPKQPAQTLRRKYEEAVVELVEVPFVQKEEIDRPESLRELGRQRRYGYIHDISERDAAHAHDQRQKLCPDRGVMGPLQRVVSGDNQDGLPPEFAPC